MADSLIPDIPDDMTGARIGSCYNQFTGKIMEDAWAILPSQAGPDDVIFTQGDAHLVITANATAEANASDSVFSLDTKAGGGYDSPAVGVKASVEFHMQNAQATSHQAENLNVYCSYAFSDPRPRQDLRKMDADELMGLMTSSFKDAYTAVIQATTAEQYVEKYFEFVAAFGHGCVTTLFLTAGSAFRLTLQRTDDASSTRQKYGGSASFSGHYGGGFGGASVAADWAKDQKTADANTKLNIELDNVPADTPTADWVSTQLNNFENQTLMTLTEKAGLITPPETMKEPTAPDPPTGVPDKSTGAGKPVVDPEKAGIDEALQKELMTQDGFDPAQPDAWEKYVQAQKTLYASVNPESVATEAAELGKQGNA